MFSGHFNAEFKCISDGYENISERERERGREKPKTHPDMEINVLNHTDATTVIVKIKDHVLNGVSNAKAHLQFSSAPKSSCRIIKEITSPEGL